MHFISFHYYRCLTSALCYKSIPNFRSLFVNTTCCLEVMILILRPHQFATDFIVFLQQIKPTFSGSRSFEHKEIIARMKEYNVFTPFESLLSADINVLDSNYNMVFGISTTSSWGVWFEVTSLRYSFTLDESSQLGEVHNPWNSHPADIANAPTLDIFKRLLG